MIVVDNATCATTSCTLSGVEAPDEVTLSVWLDVQKVTIQLLDQNGGVVESYTSP